MDPKSARGRIEHCEMRKYEACLDHTWTKTGKPLTCYPKPFIPTPNSPSTTLLLLSQPKKKSNSLNHHHGKVVMPLPHVPCSLLTYESRPPLPNKMLNSFSGV